MAWQPISFSMTDFFNAALAKSTALGGAGDGTWLGELLRSTPMIDEHDPSDDYRTPLVGDSGLQSYFTTQYLTVFVHPWLQGIGQSDGHYRYLAPANAVNAAADKFTDGLDLLTSKLKMDVLSILITGTSYADLHSTLSKFLNVFSHPEIFMCANRCRSLAALETEKKILPDADVNLRWDYSRIMTSGSFTHYVGALGNAVAMVDSNDCALESAEDELAKLAEKKAVKMGEARLAALAVEQAIQGGEGLFLFIKDQSPAVIKKILKESGAGFGAPLSVCLVLAGEPDSLDHVRNFFV